MKQVLLIAFLFLGLTKIYGQEVYSSSGKANYKKPKKEKGYDPDKLVLGGGIIFGLGNGYANLGASPIVGYRLAKGLTAGVGVGFQYYQSSGLIDNRNLDYSVKGTIIFPNVWARYFVYNNVFITANYINSIMSLTKDYDLPMFANEKYSINVNSMLVGVGLRQPIKGRLSLYAELLYDVLQDPNSPYLGLTPRLGLATGL
jgi:hypothetical protein